MSGLYLLLGRALLRRAGSRVLLLVESMLALGLIFLALVTPLALDARWTSAAWALQGAGVLWIALRQQRTWAAVMGLLLQGLACLAFWTHHPHGWPVAGGWLFMNTTWLGLAMVVGALLFSSHALQRLRRDEGIARTLAEPLVSWMLLAIALAQLWLPGIDELRQWDQPRYTEPLLAAGWSAALALAVEGFRRRLQWPALGLAAQVLAAIGLLLGAAGVLLGLMGVDHGVDVLLLRQGGLEVGVLCLLASGVLLRRQDAEGVDVPAPQLSPIVLALAGWHLLLHLAALPYAVAVTQLGHHSAWTPAALVLLPTGLTLALAGSRFAHRWPLDPHGALLRGALMKPWLAMLMLWSVGTNLLSEGLMRPLPTLPLLNPLDLMHGFAALYALKLSRSEPQGSLGSAWRRVGAAVAFFWLNSLLVRTLHHAAGTPMWVDGALGNSLVHTSLSVLWTVTALLTMGWATRRAPAHLARGVWVLGAGLLGVVVAKLFLVDLSMLNSLMRIASFLVVGLLMLVIGYVAPLPPAAGPSNAKAGS